MLIVPATCQTCPTYFGIAGLALLDDVGADQVARKIDPVRAACRDGRAHGATVAAPRRAWHRARASGAGGGKGPDGVESGIFGVGHVGLLSNNNKRCGSQHARAMHRV